MIKRSSEVAENGSDGVKVKLMSPISRGTFLKYSGATVAVTGLVLSSCNKLF